MFENLYFGEQQYEVHQPHLNPPFIVAWFINWMCCVNQDHAHFWMWILGLLPIHMFYNLLIGLSCSLRCIFTVDAILLYFCKGWITGQLDVKSVLLLFSKEWFLEVAKRSTKYVVQKRQVERTRTVVVQKYNAYFVFYICFQHWT